MIAGLLNNHRYVIKENVAMANAGERIELGDHGISLEMDGSKTYFNYFLPLDNNTARFYNRVAYDLNFGGIATTEEEGKRINNTFEDKQVLMMGNHGVTVIGETVAEAFETLYYLEKACKTMVLAYSIGQELNVLSDKLAEQTAASWDEFAGAGFAHFEQLKAMLDKTDSSYRD